MTSRERRQINYATAYREKPEGATCAFCGEDNHFVDDQGWIYIYPDEELDNVSRVTCESCWHGEPGQRHRQRWGDGDR